jgi:hypothetical protein
LSRLKALGAAFVLAGGVWTSALADDEAKPVKLPAEIQRKLGLATQPLVAASRTATVTGFARVLDPGPLAQLDADIEAAAVAAQASAAEAERTRSLHADGQTVSTKALEAAEAQARTDAARLAALRRRVALEWGEGLARLSERQRAALVEDLAAGRAALLRIDTPSGQGQAGLRSVDIDMGPLGVVHATVLGPARSADPHLFSPGVIAKVAGRAAAGLSAGLAMPVKLTASQPMHGVVLPRAALVRGGGQAWAYVKTGEENFLRRPAEAALAEADGGLFVASGFRPGETVVTTGAAALFAAETNVGEAGGGD